MTIESEVVDVKTLPAKTHTSEKDAERAELDKLVSGVSKLPIGQAIIIRGGTGKGMASRLGRSAKRLGIAESTERGSGTDAKGIYAFIRRIDNGAGK